MRAQSSLSTIARTAHEGALGFSLVATRVMLGLSCIALGSGIASAFASSCFWLPTLVKSLDACGGVGLVSTSAYLWLSGMLLVVGLFVRPVSILLGLSLIAILIAQVLNLPLIAAPQLADASWLMVVVSGAIATGGSGNIYGLNGLLYRNMRRHTFLSRFFLG